ncbi:MAG: dicarboxylate/amino acid:cation symporter [Kiritimatiellae bacterium]|nr:dicarboxylate/amino acid:cation symporter [Kiritimatiellia bacterium]
MKKYLYFRIPLFVRILISFVLGIGFGYLLYINSDAKWVENTVNIIAPFGNVLVAMLKMIVIPIIFFSLIEGASNLPVKKFGRLGGGVLLWYFSTSVFAAIFGCILAKIVNPTLDTSLVTKTFGSQLSQISQMRAGGSGNASFGDFFVSLFANPFEALSNSLFLPIIIFAILFGIACRVVADTDSKHSQAIDTLLIVVKAILNACFKIIEWILEYFPIGIFALTTVNFAKYGTDLFGPYIKIIAGVGFGVILMLVFIYPLLIYICTRVNPYKILWKIRQPVLTAFITRSSSATLPVSFQTATKEFKIKNELSSFSLPLGATINMDGVCIHLPIFAILAANIFGMPMTPLALFGLVVSIVFASVGAGGIPGGSVFLLFMVLGNMGLDEAQTMLIAALALGINPILDMFETACNVAGDNVCTYIVAKRNNMFGE